MTLRSTTLGSLGIVELRPGKIVQVDDRNDVVVNVP